jgi:D-alanyl-D-alanine carboxypeptidase/D-alanyl-D-alanine-endopeptidase (penicillin-binding protein 4)
LEAALAVPALSGARVGAFVVRASDGATVWAHAADVPLIPASNMKLLTSLAALELLGPTHRFETRILADRRPDLAGSVGDLIIRGGGDPALTSEEWWRLAADLRRSGLRKVEGDIRVDDSAFEDALWHPSWGAISSRAYHAPVGALSANYGAFFVEVSPSPELGEPTRVALDPPVEYLKATNRSRTVSEEAGDSLRVGHGLASVDQEEVIVSGALRHGSGPKLFARSVRDPALYAGSVLKMQLEGLGITVGGQVRRSESDQGVVLLVFKGRPLSEAVALTLKYSNNAMAETLVKLAGLNSNGGQGSWERGLPILRARLLESGVIGEDAVLADGSGLSTDNRVSARMLVKALQRSRSSFRVGPEMLAALPLAASDGTLADRLGSGLNRVRAKTGLLTDSRVIALSGLIETESGEERIFSILVNGYNGPTPEAVEAVDAWVSLLVP